VGAATVIARQVGGTHGAVLFRDAASAFVTGTDCGILAAAAATLIGAILAFRTLRTQDAAHPAEAS
jgi:hypothetical protein